jgi:hypothetical protein
MGTWNDKRWAVAKENGLEKVLVVVMFGFPPDAPAEDRKIRVDRLQETVRMLHGAGYKRIISVPKRDVQALATYKIDYYDFVCQARPDHKALSDDRRYIEETYLQKGIILCISDSDLRHLFTIGMTDVLPRKRIKTPKALARCFAQIPLLLSKESWATMLCWQSHNNPSFYPGVDRPEPFFKDAGRRLPSANSVVFITTRTKARGQYAPEGEHWSCSEDVHRLLAEREAGGRFLVYCPGQQKIEYWQSCNYKGKPEWLRNNKRLLELYGYKPRAERTTQSGGRKRCKGKTPLVLA